MNIPHIPVLYKETLETFKDINSGYVIDCTTGFAGHSSGLLSSNENIKLICNDQDDEALEFSKKRLEPYANRVIFNKGNFEHVIDTFKDYEIRGVSAANSGTSANYYTSWMRVNSVNAVKNYIEVTLYSDAEVPAGKNFPPCELMNIARYGNQTDESLQSCFYISSSEGRIVKLTGVTKPILENYNYGMVFGDMPEFVKSLDLPIVNGRDYLVSAL
jgi:hypothetical protein